MLEIMGIAVSDMLLVALAVVLVIVLIMKIIKTIIIVAIIAGILLALGWKFGLLSALGI